MVFIVLCIVFLILDFILISVYSYREKKSEEAQEVLKVLFILLLLCIMIFVHRSTSAKQTIAKVEIIRQEAYSYDRRYIDNVNAQLMLIKFWQKAFGGLFSYYNGYIVQLIEI